jgi:hypothetical protein
MEESGDLKPLEELHNKLTTFDKYISNFNFSKYKPERTKY